MPGRHRRTGSTGRGGDARAVKLREHVLDLARKGKPFREIAKTLNVSVATAHKHWKVAMAEAAALNVGNAEVVRQQLIEQHQLTVEKMTVLERVDPAAANAKTRALARIAALQGLDAAQKHEFSGPNGTPIAITDARVALATAIARAAAGAAPESPSGAAPVAP